jgi:hypothetical protein
VKVYFGGSISGGRDHAHTYQEIVDGIKKCGAKVLSEIFADATLTAEVGHTKDMTLREIWQRDVDWINMADAIIAEVTQPSLGVGYEIALAESLNKPVLVLFNASAGRRLSPMIGGSPRVTVLTYNQVSDIQPGIKKFLGSL